MKNFLKLIIKNRWHLHSLSFIFCYIFLIYTDKYPKFMVIGESGKFLQGFLTVFGSACVAFLIEWIQGKFFDANKTQKQVQASNFDMLVTIGAAALGMIVYFLRH